MELSSKCLQSVKGILVTDICCIIDKFIARTAYIDFGIQGA